MKLSKTQIAKIKALSVKGQSERAIAQEIGCSRSAVWYQLSVSKAASALGKRAAEVNKKLGNIKKRQEAGNAARRKKGTKNAKNN